MAAAALVTAAALVAAAALETADAASVAAVAQLAAALVRVTAAALVVAAADGTVAAVRGTRRAHRCPGVPSPAKRLPRGLRWVSTAATSPRRSARVLPWCPSGTASIR